MVFAVVLNFKKLYSLLHPPSIQFWCPSCINFLKNNFFKHHLLFWLTSLFNSGGIYSFHTLCSENSVLLTCIPKMSRLTGWKMHFYGTSQRINFFFLLLFPHDSFFCTFLPHLKICTVVSLKALTHSSASVDFVPIFSDVDMPSPYSAEPELSFISDLGVWIQHFGLWTSTFALLSFLLSPSV